MYFPIGDIHGAYNVTHKLYNKIIEEIKDGLDSESGGTFVWMGDYIDRGPDVAKVLDFLMSLEDDLEAEYPIKHIMLRGNHEAMMINCRRNTQDIMGRKMWLSYGGEETLEGFGVTLEAFIDGALDKYVIWMENLPIIAQDVDYVFVHAGVNQYLPLTKQNEDHCLWDMERSANAYRNLNKIIIHGHMTRKDGPIIDLDNKRIWMDVGANLFGRAATVCIPEPYDYGYENNPDYFRVIEVTV